MATLPTDYIENNQIRLEYLTATGPRITQLIYKPRNIRLLAEVPGAKLTSPYGDYIIHGGHRFWAAPESPEFTYIPENAGIQIQKTDHKVIMTRPVEIPTWLEKRIEVTLAQNDARVTLMHTLTNRGDKPVDCAAWGITMFPIGGSAILPLRGEAGSSLLADRQISLWPYSKFTDPRLKINDDEIIVEATNLQEFFKIGARCPQGWITYTYQGLTFKKEFAFDEDAIYYDMGSNAEIYTNGDIIEIESLSGFAKVPPGESIVHQEIWTISDSKRQD